ncbi:hypothetical protein BKA82DRAFT_4342032 [Pisolithus tinctorius]|nr:hypothetical protein BKA82DRAFT_4342032 [Pisolithus tinctorius]
MMAGEHASKSSEVLQRTNSLSDTHIPQLWWAPHEVAVLLVPGACSSSLPRSERRAWDESRETLASAVLSGYTVAQVGLWYQTRTLSAVALDNYKTKFSELTPTSCFQVLDYRRRLHMVNVQTIRPPAGFGDTDGVPFVNIPQIISVYWPEFSSSLEGNCVFVYKFPAQTFVRAPLDSNASVTYAQFALHFASLILWTPGDMYLSYFNALQKPERFFSCYPFKVEGNEDSRIKDDESGAYLGVSHYTRLLRYRKPTSVDMRIRKILALTTCYAIIYDMMTSTFELESLELWGWLTVIILLPDLEIMFQWDLAIETIASLAVHP